MIPLHNIQQNHIFVVHFFPKKMYNKSIIPLYIFSRKKKYNEITLLLYMLNWPLLAQHNRGSIVHVFHTPRQNYNFVAQVRVRKKQQNHDSILHCTTESQFLCTMFFAPPLVQHKCISVRHCGMHIFKFWNAGRGQLAILLEFITTPYYPIILTSLEPWIYTLGLETKQSLSCAIASYTSLVVSCTFSKIFFYTFFELVILKGKKECKKQLESAGSNSLFPYRHVLNRLAFGIQILMHSNGLTNILGPLTPPLCSTYLKTVTSCISTFCFMYPITFWIGLSWM